MRKNERHQAENGGVQGRSPCRTWRARLGLLAVVAAVVVPLTTLVVMQYRWLQDLEEASGTARRARLQKLVDRIDEDLYAHYVRDAEHVLSIPLPYLEDANLGLASQFVASNLPQGVRKVFLARYGGKATYWLQVFDPSRNAAFAPAFSASPPGGMPPELLAILTALAPWNMVAKGGAPVLSTDITSDERDPDHRILLRPILDTSCRLAGVAGLILDSEYFHTELLPKVTQMNLKSLGESSAISVVVLDTGNDKLVFGEPIQGCERYSASRRLTLAFQDHKLGVVHGRGLPEAWSQRNFVFNVSLSAALAAALIAGIALTFRLASREMRLGQMKSDFVSNVSHELRTPLASIRVFGELMRLGRVKDEAKVREYGTFIENESRRLTLLVNNILDFARIESGRKAYRFFLAELPGVVHTSVETYSARVAAAGFSIVLREPTEPLPLLHLDPDALDQAVCNLLDNAVKYSGESRAVEVEIGRREGWATVAVIDHGIGITPSEHRHIFERFHRVSTGLVHEVRGSGLGLSIVKHVVEAHGGHVEVESEVGRGSTFTILLPLPGGGLTPPTGGGA